MTKEHKDEHKKDDKPVDPKTTVAQQPPGQRHPQQDPDKPSELDDGPDIKEATPWYNPSPHDIAEHERAAKKNYTVEEMEKQQEEARKRGEAEAKEHEARVKKDNEAAKVKQAQEHDAHERKNKGK